MSCRRLIGLASLVTHLPLLALSYIPPAVEAHSSSVEAGLHGGVLWTCRTCEDARKLGAALVNQNTFAPFCEQKRSMPAIPYEAGGGFVDPDIIWSGAEERMFMQKRSCAP